VKPRSACNESTSPPAYLSTPLFAGAGTAATVSTREETAPKSAEPASTPVFMTIPLFAGADATPSPPAALPGPSPPVACASSSCTRKELAPIPAEQSRTPAYLSTALFVMCNCKAKESVPPPAKSPAGMSATMFSRRESRVAMRTTSCPTSLPPTDPTTQSPEAAPNANPAYLAIPMFARHVPHDDGAGPDTAEIVKAPPQPQSQAAASPDDPPQTTEAPVVPPAEVSPEYDGFCLKDLLQARRESRIAQEEEDKLLLEAQRIGRGHVPDHSAPSKAVSNIEEEIFEGFAGLESRQGTDEAEGAGDHGQTSGGTVVDQPAADPADDGHGPAPATSDPTTPNDSEGIVIPAHMLRGHPQAAMNIPLTSPSAVFASKPKRVGAARKPQLGAMRDVGVMRDIEPPAGPTASADRNPRLGAVMRDTKPPARSTAIPDRKPRLAAVMRDVGVMRDIEPPARSTASPDCKPRLGAMRDVDHVHAAVLAVSARCELHRELERVARGKYMLGDKKLYIRVMRNSIIVRVGGGWASLETYLNSRRHQREFCAASQKEFAAVIRADHEANTDMPIPAGSGYDAVAPKPQLLRVRSRPFGLAETQIEIKNVDNCQAVSLGKIVKKNSHPALLKKSHRLKSSPALLARSPQLPSSRAIHS